MNADPLPRAVRDRWTDSWQKPLGFAGCILAFFATAVLLTAWQTATDKAKPNLGVLLGAAGLAMLIAGFLMIAGRRRDLVEKLLAGLTAASFAIGLAVASAADPATSAETVFATFQPALIFAACLFVALGLKDGYRGSHLGRPE
jgi:peptidoglycan/LPS O-acetylase OafA/YrhL